MSGLMSGLGSLAKIQTTIGASSVTVILCLIISSLASAVKHYSTPMPMTSEPGVTQQPTLSKGADIGIIVSLILVLILVWINVYLVFTNPTWAAFVGLGNVTSNF